MLLGLKFRLLWFRILSATLHFPHKDFFVFIDQGFFNCVLRNFFQWFHEVKLFMIIQNLCLSHSVDICNDDAKAMQGKGAKDLLTPKHKSVSNSTKLYWYSLLFTTTHSQGCRKPVSPKNALDGAVITINFIKSENMSFAIFHMIKWKVLIKHLCCQTQNDGFLFPGKSTWVMELWAELAGFFSFSFFFMKHFRLTWKNDKLWWFFLRLEFFVSFNIADKIVRHLKFKMWSFDMCIHCDRIPSSS